MNDPQSNSLRVWQDKALAYFKQHPECIIEAATGTGKTRLTVSILKYIYSKYPRAKTVIVVPKNVILEKTWFKTLTQYFGLNNIGLFYGDVKEPSMITITNIQSIDKLDLSDCDVLIADELHNMFSDRLIEYLKTPVLYKLGLTATLKRKDAKHWSVLEIFGFNLFQYSLEQGVKDKILSEYRFHNVPIRLLSEEQKEYEEINNKISQIEFARRSINRIALPESREQRYAMYDRRKKILCNSIEKINVLDKLYPLIRDKKIILFNEYIEITNSLYWKFIDLGMRPCLFHTGIPKKKRMQNLDDYAKGKFDIIITVKSLDEGYDLPDIQTAVILSGGNTSRQVIQRAGRVLRQTGEIKDIYQVYFSNTIEEETALKRYELIKDSCKQYKVLTL